MQISKFSLQLLESILKSFVKYIGQPFSGIHLTNNRIAYKLDINRFENEIILWRKKAFFNYIFCNNSRHKSSRTISLTQILAKSISNIGALQL